MMAEICRCGVTECKYNEDKECTAEYIYIEEELTASGFHPMCSNYEERE